MPYASEHMVLQWTATVRSGMGQTSPAADIVSGSLRFQGPGIAEADSENSLAALTLVLTNYWKDGVAAIPDNCWLESVKWNRVGTDGKYVNQNTRESLPSGVRGALAPRYPLQVAWATTWTTDVVRGKACRGRTFWPTAESLAGGVTIGAPTCAAKATRDHQLIVDLNRAARNGYISPRLGISNEIAAAVGLTPGPLTDGPGLSASVMSRIGAGVSRVITGAEVGTRLDVQRRRANKQTDIRLQGEDPQPS